MRPEIGQDLLDIIRTADPSIEINDHLFARTGGRILEEAVELAIDCGQSAEGVYKHVSDAVFNECRKRSCFPSELHGKRGDRASMIGELADNQLLIEYTRNLAGITQEEIDAAAEAKVAKLRAKLESGELYVVDGLMYTQKAPGR